MFINHFQVKGEERLIQEHTQYSDISEEGVGEEETRSTNEANAVGNVATEAAVRLEEIPSHSSSHWTSLVTIEARSRLKIVPSLHLEGGSQPTRWRGPLDFIDRGGLS